MDKAIVILVVIGLAVACFAVAGLASGAMEAETEAHKTKAQVALIQAETERAKVEILRESQRTLEDVATATAAVVANVATSILSPPAIRYSSFAIRHLPFSPVPPAPASSGATFRCHAAPGRPRRQKRTSTVSR